ncbi:MAG: hypothetical protein KDD58_06050 [Bdellovibrionales bacterium]|nr:hypothetical protein [Bdellovibrionales bacterium]
MKFLILFLSMFSVTSVHAFESWELEAGVEVPLQISGRAKTNFNSEFYATAGLGLAMDFLMGVNSALVGGVGILGENTAEVVESALSNSIVVDLRGGWNLHKYNGLYVEAGYMYMMGGGSEVTVDQLENAFGSEYINNPLLMSNASEFTIGSDLHALTFHAGYRWEINESWLFNVDVGIVKPFMSSTTVDVDRVYRGTGTDTQATEVANALASHAESEIEDVYLSELFIPTASVWVSWLF